MAYHIVNTLRIVGTKEQVKEVLDFIQIERRDKTDYIDFNKILPVPEEFDNIELDLAVRVHSLFFGSHKKSMQAKTIEDQQWFSGLNKKEQEDLFKLALQCQSNLQKYNHTTRNDWIIEHWGTRWAYIIEHDIANIPEIIQFKSWIAPPFPFIIELSRRFPKVLLELRHDFLGYEDQHCTIKYRKGKKISKVYVWRGVIREEEEEGEDEWINDYYRPDKDDIENDDIELDIKPSQMF